MELFLIRHCQTYANVQRITQGWINGRLTKKGREQAQIIGEKLKKQHKKNNPFEIIYSSSLRRAEQTAIELAKKLKVPIEKTELMKERGYGKLEGKPLNLLPEGFVGIDANENGFSGKGVESFKDIRKRIKRFLKILKSKRHKKIIVVGHAEINNYFLNILLGEKLGSVDRHQKNGEAFHLILDNKGRIIKWNKISFE